MPGTTDTGSALGVGVSDTALPLCGLPSSPAPSPLSLSAPPPSPPSAPVPLHPPAPLPTYSPAHLPVPSPASAPTTSRPTPVPVSASALLSGLPPRTVLRHPPVPQPIPSHACTLLRNSESGGGPPPALALPTDAVPVPEGAPSQDPSCPAPSPPSTPSVRMGPSAEEVISLEKALAAAANSAQRGHPASRSAQHLLRKGGHLLGQAAPHLAPHGRGEATKGELHDLASESQSAVVSDAHRQCAGCGGLYSRPSLCNHRSKAKKSKPKSPCASPGTASPLPDDPLFQQLRREGQFAACRNRALHLWRERFTGLPPNPASTGPRQPPRPARPVKRQCVRQDSTSSSSPEDSMDTDADSDSGASGGGMSPVLTDCTDDTSSDSSSDSGDGSDDTDTDSDDTDTDSDDTDPGSDGTDTDSDGHRRDGGGSGDGGRDSGEDSGSGGGQDTGGDRDVDRQSGRNRGGAARGGGSGKRTGYTAHARASGESRGPLHAQAATSSSKGAVCINGPVAPQARIGTGGAGPGMTASPAGFTVIQHSLHDGRSPTIGSCSIPTAAAAAWRRSLRLLPPTDRVLRMCGPVKWPPCTPSPLEWFWWPITRAVLTAAPDEWCTLILAAWPPAPALLAEAQVDFARRRVQPGMFVMSAVDGGMGAAEAQRLWSVTVTATGGTGDNLGPKPSRGRPNAADLATVQGHCTVSPSLLQAALEFTRQVLSGAVPKPTFDQVRRVSTLATVAEASSAGRWSRWSAQEEGRPTPARSRIGSHGTATSRPYMASSSQPASPFRDPVHLSQRRVPAHYSTPATPAVSGASPGLAASCRSRAAAPPRPQDSAVHGDATPAVVSLHDSGCAAAAGEPQSQSSASHAQAAPTADGSGGGAVTGAASIGVSTGGGGTVEADSGEGAPLQPTGMDCHLRTNTGEGDCDQTGGHSPGGANIRVSRASSSAGDSGGGDVSDRDDGIGDEDVGKVQAVMVPSGTAVSVDEREPNQETGRGVPCTPDVQQQSGQPRLPVATLAAPGPGPCTGPASSRLPPLCLRPPTSRVLRGCASLPWPPSLPPTAWFWWPLTQAALSATPDEWCTVILAAWPPAAQLLQEAHCDFATRGVRLGMFVADRMDGGLTPNDVACLWSVPLEQEVVEKEVQASGGGGAPATAAVATPTKRQRREEVANLGAVEGVCSVCPQLLAEAQGFILRVVSGSVPKPTLKPIAAVQEKGPQLHRRLQAPPGRTEGGTAPAPNSAVHPNRS
jgi:hypothetical protein